MTRNHEGTDTIEIRWTYTPTGFFEEPLDLSCDSYDLVIDAGTIRATFDARTYDADPTIRERLHRLITARFLGGEVTSRRGYSLSEPSVTRFHADGRRTDYLEPRGAMTLGPKLGSPDVTVKDSEGRILSDSRRERIEETNRLGELISRVCESDPKEDRVLKAYDEALQYPEREIQCYFEIVEAVKTQFNGGERARKALGLSKADFGAIGRIANDPSIDVSRHRGRRKEPLRAAAAGERQNAREAANRIVRAYLFYLERSGA